MIVLAQTGNREAQLAGTALWLWIVFACTAVIFLGAAWLVIARQRKMLLASRAKRKQKPIRDAWQEAGRRLQVEDEDSDADEEEL